MRNRMTKYAQKVLKHQKLIQTQLDLIDTISPQPSELVHCLRDVETVEALCKVLNMGVSEFADRCVEAYRELALDRAKEEVKRLTNMKEE